MSRRPKSTNLRRPLAFVAVASGGFMLQVATVAMMMRLLHAPAELATGMGVELAVIHNFLWHEHWTWGDRPSAITSRLRRFTAYQLATGCTSIAGNIILVATAVRAVDVDAAAANVLAVLVMSAANYAIADRWVFRARAVATLAVLVMLPVTAASAQPAPETIRAWEAHIADVERGQHTGGSIHPGEAHGTELRIPGGLIHEWSGAVIIPNIRVEDLVHALAVPGTPPPQEDVLESRVLARSGDTLRVYLKLQRTAIITVTYDTEHTVTFVRHSSSLYSSRSVATSIQERGGGDRGFLWRLNSYWTYRQTANGVRVEVRSVSLSRDVPMLARPFASPIAGRIARESMRRTLEAMRQFGAALEAQ